MDKELLELAAKAVGYARMKYFDDTPYISGDINGDDFLPWNPLEDDGDALRLAVKLRIDIRLFDRTNSDHMDCLVDRLGRGFGESRGSDPYAATRRAIVRAAAEIGREK